MQRKSPFSVEWWDEVLLAWNRDIRVKSLACLGPVCFRVLDTQVDPVWVSWDEDGNAVRTRTPLSDALCLSATAQNWQAFITGEFKATTGVLAGRLVFKGQLRKILPYSEAFNDFARVARTVTPP